jgi:hypothetical protein
MKAVPSAVRKAVADLSAARKALAQARLRLARLTKTGHPAYLVDPDWTWAEDLMKARRAKLLAIPGVVGVGLGFRLHGGAPTDLPCLTVYVRKKLPLAELVASGLRRIPRTVGSRRRRLHVDVVELGGIRRQIGAGDSLGPAGGGERGTLGALATDLAAADTVALTAMHVTSLPEFPFNDAAAPRFVSPMPGGSLFASLRQGTMTGIDAAKLALDVQQPAVSELPSIGRIKGWRPITFPGDRGTMVRMFGAVSGPQAGFIVNPIASLPGERLDAAILVNVFSQGGDSGAALVDGQGLLLGFLVGEGGPTLNTLRVFTPASLVMATLRCDIPTT